MSKLKAGTKVKVISNRDSEGRKMYPKTIIGATGVIINPEDKKDSLYLPEYVVLFDDRLDRRIEAVYLDKENLEVIKEEKVKVTKPETIKDKK